MNYKKYILFFCFLLLPLLLLAEVVVLQSGQSVKGDIVLQNEDVVIIRATNGMRYQYPMSEVLDVKQDEHVSEPAQEKKDAEDQFKHVAVCAQTVGGGVYVPYMGWGGNVGASLKIGANLLEEKQMFVGGEVGYKAMIFTDQTYSFIPLQFFFSTILNSEKHAPIVGVNVGYSFSANRKTQGGICAGANVGWHYKIDHDTSIALGISTDWQQAKTEIKQMIVNPDTNEQKDYTNYMGVNFITLAVRLAIHF